MEIDAANLNSQASFRRTAKVAPVQGIGWTCEYCNKTLATEAYFMRHDCKEKKRAAELETPIGKSAYLFYCDWMKYYKRKPPTIETFATSRYYNSFIEFAKHVKNLNIKNVDKFLEILCQKDLSPILWRRDQCYSLYLEWVDKHSDPLEQVKTSIETLIAISEKEGVDLDGIFEHMGPKLIAEQVRLRTLSPWFLFCSRKFNSYLKTISQEDVQELSSIINPSYWTSKLQSNMKVVKEIMEINKGMGF